MLLVLALLAAQPSPELASLCPLGDHVNVSVYDFVAWELGRRKKAPLSRDEVRGRIDRDAKARHQPDIKPERASIVESPVSNLISALCESHPTCISAAIYDADGLAFALSTKGKVIDAVGIGDDARWTAMTRPDNEQDGLVAPLSCDEAKTLGVSCKRKLFSTAFPIYVEGKLLGVARCLVEPKAAAARSP
jgi:hypothetical protein